jgi:hypothetical protein
MQNSREALSLNVKPICAGTFSARIMSGGKNINHWFNHAIF